MLDQILRAVQTNVAELSDWWDSLNTTYRAAGCLLVSLFLMLQATRASAADRDRNFFLTGIVALGFLAYGAVLFVHGDVR